MNQWFYSTQPKETTSNEDNPSIIYKINFSSCNKHHIGQSDQPLHLRQHEHQLAAKQHNTDSYEQL